MPSGIATHAFERTIEVFPVKTGKDKGTFKWRSVAKNGRVTAVSHDTFSKMGNAERAADKESAAWRGNVRILRAEE